MLKLSTLEIFHGAINTPSTDIEYTNKLKRYEEFFNSVDWDEYVKKDPNKIHDYLGCVSPLNSTFDSLTSQIFYTFIRQIKGDNS